MFNCWPSHSNYLYSGWCFPHNVLIKGAGSTSWLPRAPSDKLITTTHSCPTPWSPDTSPLRTYSPGVRERWHGSDNAMLLQRGTDGPAHGRCSVTWWRGWPVSPPPGTPPPASTPSGRCRTRVSSRTVTITISAVVFYSSEKVEDSGVNNYRHISIP